MPSTEFTNGNSDSRNKSSAADDDDVEDYVAECGVGRFKPALLRNCASIPAFTGFIGCSALVTSTLSTYVNSQVTTLERHFGFNSSQTGLIMAANEIAFFCVVLFISYLAVQIHIPRVLGVFTIMFGLSGFVCALPYFFFGAPNYQSDVSAGGNATEMTSNSTSLRFSGQLCDGVEEPTTQCDFKGEVKSSDVMSQVTDTARANAGTAMAIILVGMLLEGIAKGPRAPLSVAYIDDNVEKTTTAFYVGIILTASTMGPGVAFGLGALFSSVYVTLEDTDLHPRHPRWIGAWWLGYITFGMAACIISLPVFCFPRRIKRQTTNPSSARKAGTSICSRAIFSCVKGWLGALCRLLANPVYMCSCVSATAAVFCLAGMRSFAAKYIENQFSLPAFKANFSLALLMMCTGCVGTFAGGYVSKHFKWGPLTCTKVVLILRVLCTFFTAIGMAFKCDQPTLYNSPGPRAISDDAMSGCYDNCTCDDNDFFPICDGDGRTFFSPCHAGCAVNAGNSYTNCTCIPGHMATAGMCDYSCNMFYPFIAFTGVLALTSTVVMAPVVVIFVRSVEDRDKSLSIGLMGFMTSLAGWMLGPVVFGKLIDDICIQWENPEDSCTGRGACLLYDNDAFRWNFLGFQTGFNVFAALCMAFALLAAVLTKKFDEVDSVASPVQVGSSAIGGELMLREDVIGKSSDNRVDSS